MVIEIKEKGKSTVYIDREAEVDIVERAFEGIQHLTLQTKELSARTDAAVALPDLSHFVVEVKDRDRDYAFISRLGPLVDKSKAEAVAAKAETEGATPVIIWRTTDGFLIGADARDILEHGEEDPAYQRLKGNRPQDKPKSVMVLSLDYCYVRPPADIPTGRLERDWLEWLSAGNPENLREEQ